MSSEVFKEQEGHSDYDIIKLRAYPLPRLRYRLLEIFYKIGNFNTSCVFLQVTDLLQ